MMRRVALPLLAALLCAAPAQAWRHGNPGYSPSFQAGGYDASGNYLGGNEVRDCAGHLNVLYCGVSYWGNSYPLANYAYIMSLAGPQNLGNRWAQDFNLGSGNLAAVRLQEYTFTTTANGTPVAAPFPILFAGAWSIATNPYIVQVLTRNDTANAGCSGGHQWCMTTIDEPPSIPNGQLPQLRSLQGHVDNVTHVSMMFAGLEPAGIFAGSLNNGSTATSYGITWGAAPELDITDFAPVATAAGAPSTGSPTIALASCPTLPAGTLYAYDQTNPPNQAALGTVSSCSGGTLTLTGNSAYNGRAASFTGSISGTTLTLNSNATGTFQINQNLAGAGIANSPYILSKLSGALGANGSTYQINVAQGTIASEPMTAGDPVQLSPWQNLPTMNVRPMSMAECTDKYGSNNLYASVSPVLEVRHDGSSPYWTPVYTFAASSLFTSNEGLRGITCIRNPNLTEGGGAILAVAEGGAVGQTQHPEVLLIDINTGTATVDLDLNTYLNGVIGGSSTGYVIGAYSDMIPYAGGELIGLTIEWGTTNSPGAAPANPLLSVYTGLSTGEPVISQATYLWRSSTGQYSFFVLPPVSAYPQYATRAIAASPWAPGLFYFGGADTYQAALNNFAWITLSPVP